MSSQRPTQGPPGRNLLETYFRLAPVTIPFYAILVACLVGSLFILGAGANPLVAYGALLDGAFGSPDRIASTVARSTPFIIGALAVALGFKAGLFNIGAEGQLLLGALTAAWSGPGAGWLGRRRSSRCPSCSSRGLSAGWCGASSRVS